MKTSFASRTCREPAVSLLPSSLLSLPWLSTTGVYLGWLVHDFPSGKRRGGYSRPSTSSTGSRDDPGSCSLLGSSHACPSQLLEEGKPVCIPGHIVSNRFSKSPQVSRRFSGRCPPRNPASCSYFLRSRDGAFPFESVRTLYNPHREVKSGCNICPCCGGGVLAIL